ncbi:SoxAX cytochrome complex subunit A [compost metagenome]
MKALRGRVFLLALAIIASSQQAAGADAQSSPASDPRRSGFEFMGPSTQAMQKDDALNPGMLWVKDGEALWQKTAGLSGKACVSCHAAAASSMKGVAARYPAFDDALKRPVSLSQRINICRQQHQQAEPLRAESQELLSLESYVALQSRGMPLAPPADGRLEPFRQRGQQLFTQRMGQLNLSCAQCHDDHAGQRLGSSLIPQAHSTGYPIYRLEWQALGSLQRRLRGCMNGVRAEPFAYGAQELVELELYLAARASGMPMETPGVRP